MAKSLRDRLLESTNLLLKSSLNSLDGNIMPADQSNLSLGSADKKFKAVYADEVHISQNTLYIGDTPILGTSQDTINIKADPDQSILVKTTGTGSSQITSENGILLKTSGTTANININADGTNSEVTMNAKTRVSLNAPSIVLEGSTTINDLTVTGTTTTVNSTNLAVKDNIIEINSGETGTGVSLGTAGIKINRGDYLPYMIQFDESDDMFKIGEQGNLETIASQNYVDEKVANAASMITGLAKVATTGSYNDLSNKPTIPTSLPANGGNAATVGGFTVGVNVPADAKFTDTNYMPSNSKITISLSGDQQNYTAPENGWICVTCKTTVSSCIQAFALINNANSIQISQTMHASGKMARGFMPVSKGQDITVYWASGGCNERTMEFIYING